MRIMEREERDIKEYLDRSSGISVAELRPDYSSGRYYHRLRTQPATPEQRALARADADTAKHAATDLDNALLARLAKTSVETARA